MANTEYEYYIGYRDENNEYWSYESDRYKLTEVDLLNMIKILYVEGRNKTIGKKLIEVFREVHEKDKAVAQKKLELIGITENGDRHPTREKHLIQR